MSFTSAQILALPTFTVPAAAPLLRVHPRDLEAWHASRGDGRFDPISAGNALGACYTADDELGAFVETYRRTNPISEADLDGRRITTLKAPRALVLVDLTARDAALAGPDVSALSSDWDYTEPQAFASAAADAGRDGIRYFARHDPAKALVCNAIFGTTTKPTLHRSTPRPLSKRLLSRAAADFGYRIIPVP